MTIEQKAFEARDSVAKGAQELDIVITTREIKNANTQYLIREMEAVREAVPNAVVKFNIEIEYLNRDEIALVCRCAKEAGVDYITTSTGLYHIVDENLNDVPLVCKVEDIAYIIAVFKIKAHIHTNETTLNSQKAKHSERRVESHSEEHPGTLP